MDEILATNLTSNIRLGKAFLKHYAGTCLSGTRQSKPADPYIESSSTSPRSHVFVAVSSLLANKAGKGASVYAASKAGLNSFVRTMCLEASAFAKKNSPELPVFRANVVEPGYVDTPMLKGFSQDSRDKLNDVIPLGRFARPEEVADAVLFLVTNEYAHNTVLNLDGGLSAT